MKKLIAVLGLSTLALSSCETRQQPVQAKTDTVGYKLEEAKWAEGKNIYEKSCNTCHQLYDTESRTAEQWAPILAVMVKKAKLDATQSALVQSYVFAHARK